MISTTEQVFCPDSWCIRCGPQTTTIHEDEPESWKKTSKHPK